MKMYSREDLMNMKNFGGEEDADDDEDDDETRFPSKLVRIKTNRFPFFSFFLLAWIITNHADNCLLLQGKVLKERESKNKDWKQRLTTGILDVGQTVKNHASKVSQRMSRWWWKAKKEILKKKSKKTSKKSGKVEL